MIGMRAARLLLFLALTSAATGGVHAQHYPSKSIRLIAPFPAGGPTDMIARVAARALQAKLGQTVVVENQGGAGGTIGARYVAGAAPDGYTLMMIAVANTFGTQPVLYKLDFDPLKTFVPVATVAVDKQMMVANPNAPFRNATELVGYARANPGKLNYGAAIGIGPHFVMELFKIKTGTNIVHVPYRGSGPIIADVIGGQIHMMLSGKSVLLPHVQAGKLRAISVSAAKRWPELPEVGTLIEAGYLDAPYEAIFGVVAPAGTPRETIAALNSAINEGLRATDVQASIASLGIEPTITTPTEFAAIIAAEAPRWAEIVRLTGVKAGE
jgi:tripartite-type tricarboxylate transporter receptor subunit TctC